MAIRRPSTNVMDVAKESGRRMNYEKAVQDLKRQEAEQEQELDKYQSDVALKDLATQFGTSFVVNKGIEMALAGLTSGGSTVLLPLLKGLFGKAKAGKDTMKLGSIMMKLLGKGIKGGVKYGLSDFISGKTDKPVPSAISYDMDKLTGPGYKKYSGSISDALALSKTGYKGRIEGIDRGRDMQRLLTSAMGELKTPMREGGDSIFDILKSTFTGGDVATDVATDVPITTADLSESGSWLDAYEEWAAKDKSFPKGNWRERFSVKPPSLLNFLNRD